MNKKYQKCIVNERNFPKKFIDKIFCVTKCILRRLRLKIFVNTQKITSIFKIKFQKTTNPCRIGPCDSDLTTGKLRCESCQIARYKFILIFAPHKFDMIMN